MQAEALQKIQHAMHVSGVIVQDPADVAQFLADSQGLEPAKEFVSEIIQQVENDVADWDFWTEVKKCLLC